MQTIPPRRVEDRIRLFHRTELHWTQHLAEQVDLEAGSAFTNPALSRLASANRMLAGALPAGGSVDEAFAQVERHFAGHGVRCLQWVLNPDIAEPAAGALTSRLLSSGYTASAPSILALSASPSAVRLPELLNLTLFPARASYRHARLLAEVVAAECNEPQLVEARLLHLEDSHCDSLLALRGSEVVGSVDVLTVGDAGRIDGLYVAPGARGQGVGQTLLSRAIEICARAAFRDVVLGLSVATAAHETFFRRAGFEPIGTCHLFTRS